MMISLPFYFQKFSIAYSSLSFFYAQRLNRLQAGTLGTKRTDASGGNSPEINIIADRLSGVKYSVNDWSIGAIHNLDFRIRILDLRA